MKVPGSLLLFLLCVFASGLYSQKEDPYADKPSWYRPGHPLDPAEPAAIETLPGFKVEKLLSIPEAVGSLTTMTVEANGDIIVATQHEPGLFRFTPSAIGSGASPRLEPMRGVARTFGWAQGLLYAFDSLYVTVSEPNGVRSPGVYRLMDSDGNGEFDEALHILELDATGEHAAHNMVVGPNETSLYLMCGNGTPVPDTIQNKRTVSTEGQDHLIPDGFGTSQYTEGGWVVRMDPDGGNPELYAGGLRNSYDLAFNEKGDLFTFDSDMEYDLGMPWYRPTRICHIVSGSEFGWRAGTAKWPEYYEDSVRPVVNIGPSSPTGVLFGYEAAFPEKYKKAFIVLDWTFATIYAVHLQSEGAGYSAEYEIFASGVGLPLTDCVIGRDGALYFCVGGRKLGSAVYRIWYTGTDVEPYAKEVSFDESRDLRLSLESLHGKVKSSAVDQAWAHLGSEDPMIRFAARIALESQPVNSWKARVLAEENLQIKFPALLALARQGNPADLISVLDRLREIDFSVISEEGLLLGLRTYEWVLSRGGFELRELAESHAGRLRPLLPHESSNVNRELSRILCYLNDRSAINPLLELMEQDEGEKSVVGAELVSRNLVYGKAVMNMLEAPPMVERMHHAQMLTWIHEGWNLEQRKRFFKMAVESVMTSKGGKGYTDTWERIIQTVRESLTAKETKELSSIWADLDKVEPLPKPSGPGKLWDMDYLLSRIEKGFGKRDFENGKKMYAAGSCVTCHVIMGSGGIVGPDLTSLGQRFTIRDILDSIINPSNALSDQYQLMTILLKSGEVVSGRIHSRDARNTVVAANVMKPTFSRTIPNAEIVSITPLPVSTMPPGLINTMNEEEVLDLIAYLVSGGHPEHVLFTSDSSK